MNRAVFLDRDGVINELTRDYVKDWGEFRFLPNSLKALKRLAKSDYKIIVITNQSAVGRGRITREKLENIHFRMLVHVEEAGGRIDGIYVCMHLPSEGCGCRKPKTGLLKLASASFDIDLKRSWFVGDNTMDVKTGDNAGCKTILVETGYGGEDGLYDIKPDYKVGDILGAVGLILAKRA